MAASGAGGAAAFDVVVVGGGLAGCAAAIHLARSGAQVLVLEKQDYPAHKLCGEFLSTEVQGLLERLGVWRAIEAAHPHRIHRTRITAPNGRTFEAALPGTALGLSRYRLDALLAAAAREAGATVLPRTEVQAVEGSLGTGFVVTAGTAVFRARAVVGSYGKQGKLDRTLARALTRPAKARVAFKMHFDGVHLPHLIELHAFAGGYCGLSHIEDGGVNACWIADAEVLKTAGGKPEQMIATSFQANPHLAARFAAMQPRWERYLSVSQIRFRPKGAFAGDVCLMGDTAGMIAPLCGDGMAMALRTAEWGTPWLRQFLRGEVGASAFKQGYARAWHQHFGWRMQLGRWLHQGFVRPGVAGAGLRLCQAVPRLGSWLIAQTRDTRAAPASTA